MPRIAEKTAGIRQHTDKAGQISLCSETAQLINHPLFVVIEPPGAAVLHFPYCFPGLERAHHRLDRGVVVRIKGIEDRLRQFTGFVQSTEKRCQLLDGGLIADGVNTGIRAESLKDTPGVIPYYTEVQLHHQTALGICSAQAEQKGRFKLFFFPCIR